MKYLARTMWPNDPKLSHSHDERGCGEQKPENMNLLIIVRKTARAVAVGCSDLLGSPYFIHDEENLRENRERQWARNKQRLITLIGNILTLGLGENLWYGDRIYRKVNRVSLPILRRKDDVNIPNSPHSPLHAQQVSNAGNEVKRLGHAYVWVFLGYKLTLERLCFHNHVAQEPNVPKLSHADRQVAPQTR
jgi:hypothetical protein